MSPTDDWLFSAERLEVAAAYYRHWGYVGFTDLLSPTLVDDLLATVEHCLADGRLKLGEDAIAANNDVIYLDPLFEELCRHVAVVRAARMLVGHPIELQHAKFNAKPLRDSGGGVIPWHQDFAFFPHSNFDLTACLLHLDDEDADNGPLRVIPGSHRWGPVPHCREGHFAYQYTGDRDLEATPSRALAAKRGMVTFHHGLTLHKSDANRSGRHRRLMIFQFRAQDAVQLAGVGWRCNGFAVESPARPRMARFPDGTRVELRGDGGRLYDVYGRLAADR